MITSPQNIMPKYIIFGGLNTNAHPFENMANLVKLETGVALTFETGALKALEPPKLQKVGAQIPKLGVLENFAWQIYPKFYPPFLVSLLVLGFSEHVNVT